MARSWAPSPSRRFILVFSRTVRAVLLLLYRIHRQRFIVRRRSFLSRRQETFGVFLDRVCLAAQQRYFRRV